VKKKGMFGLVCTGGGAHGAYQVGVLKYIHEKFSHGKQSPFQIFAGSSCGALNTTFYAAQSYDAYESRLWLEDLWRSFHVPAYHGNIFKSALVTLYKEWRKHPDERTGAWAFLDPSPMYEVVAKGFRREGLDRSIKEGTTRGVGVVATEMISGRACWFLEGQNAHPWHLFHSIGLLDKLTAKHLHASCSVPLFLPPVKLGHYYFLDGSISLDRPLSAAIGMGANKILTIATEKPVPTDLPSPDAYFRPRLSNVVRLLLNRLSRDSARDEAAQIDMFNRFYRALSRKSKKKDQHRPLPLFHEQAQPAHYEDTEVCIIFPSKRIRETTGITDDLSGSSTPRKRTRFMFHEKFIKELILLGYHDAKNRHAELQEFFLPGTVHRKWLQFARRKKSLSL
jgi:NTE family protein